MSNRTNMYTDRIRGRWVSASVLSAMLAMGLGATVGTAPAFGEEAGVAHSDSVGAAIGDTKITAEVKAKYVGNDALKGSDISVKTTNGVVTLTGTAASSDAKDVAQNLANGVDGVKSVDNELTTPGTNGKVHRTVRKGERVGSDSWITTKVKSGLLADSLTRGSKVHVKTVKGVVTLTGTLASDDAVEHAKDMAEKVQGVKSVNADGLTAAQ